MLDYVFIELGGKTRKLKYDFNAVADIEAQANMGLPALLMGPQAGFNTLRWLIWGGLKHEQKNLMPWKVGDWLQQYMVEGGTYKQLMDLAMKALELGKVIGATESETGEDEEGEAGNG